jgi:preprotein translocase subunit SecE
MNKVSKYISESITEMKKVTWPSKKETYQYTVLVIVISLSVALFLWLLDQFFDFSLQIFIIS